MRIFIHTRTSLSIPSLILMDTIKALVNVYLEQNQYQIFIIGSALPASFTAYCNKLERVAIINPEEATVLLKSEILTTYIHFGTKLKGTHTIQQLFIPLAFPYLQGPWSFIAAYFLKKQFADWMKKAHQVICINDWAYAQIKAQYPQYDSKLHSIYLPSLTVPSFEWQELSKAQEDLTRGHHYFLFFAPVERFKAILKEFSVFKKWQQTTMHLVFVFDHAKEVDIAMLQLKGYKYKQDITIVRTEDICMEWLAASYAILFEGSSFNKSSWITYAIAYEVPLLFAASLQLPDTWHKAGEVFSFSDQQALSNHFKLYYKDEIYRQSIASLAKDWLVAENKKAIQMGLTNSTLIQ